MKSFYLPWRSALTLSKHSEPDDKSSGKVVSRTETGLGCSASLELDGDSGSGTEPSKGTELPSDDPFDGSWNIIKDLEEKYVKTQLELS